MLKKIYQKINLLDFFLINYLKIEKKNISYLLYYTPNNRYLFILNKI